MRFFQEDLIANFISLIGQNDLYIYNYQALKSANIKNIPKALKTCCLNNIGSQYINTQHRHLASNNDSFDLAIISDRPIGQITQLANSIRGFIIVQKGECEQMADVYCINLICSHKGKGSTLIALYLYCINNNTQITIKKGLLELANSYYNVGGLCLYSKYGFEYDDTLYSRQQTKCFDDYNNLPMIVDLTEKYKTIDNCNQTLKDILLGTNKGFPKPTICDLRGAKQQILGLAMNLDKFLKLGVTDYIIDYTLSDDTVLHYDVFYNDFMNSDANQVASFINNIQSMPDTQVDQYAEVIEYPLLTPPELPLRRTARTLQSPSPPQESVKRQRRIGGGNKSRRIKRRYRK